MARGVDSDCKITAPTDLLVAGSEFGLGNTIDQCARPFPQLPALAQDERGTYMYIGDAATLSFLHSARRIVHSVLAYDFVDDSLQKNKVHQRDFNDGPVGPSPAKPTPQDADYLIHWFNLATNCLLNLIDQQELTRGLNDWCQCPQDPDSGSSAMYYLVLALGAQSCPEDRDETAERYFNHGRYITLTTFMEDPTIITIQCHVLITMYLLAGSRRNSAFMYLGTAVRAAYALGLHKEDVSTLYSPSEYCTRERLWRAIRILDLFTSASLGRPPSTTETRDTTAQDNYSASNDLCFIFETILTQIYAKRTVTKEALAWITHLHRGWTSRFPEGLKTDGIPDSESLETDRGRVPNLGLIQLKEAYYWTVMLLTQPVLIDKFSHTAPTSASNILATACIDSAIRTSTLLTTLSNPTLHIPKRLPLITNSAFLSALVLGLAIFADMDKTLPLHDSLQNARCVLARFAPHDAATKNHLAIVDSFRDACHRYVEFRARRELNHQGRLLAGVFGSLDTNPSSTTHGHHHRPGQSQDRTSLIDNDIALPSINISDGSTPFQNDIETAFFNVPSPPGYSHSCTDVDASGTLDSEIAPLSPKTLQTLDCYGYDVGVDVDIEWPLVSAVDASA